MTCAGSIIVPSMTRNMPRLPRNRMRAKAMPTRLELSTVPTVTSTEITTLLASASRKPRPASPALLAPMCDSASG